MGLVIAIVVSLTLLYCVNRHGLISFVTLGCAGMAIYSIPGIMGVELPFWVTAVSSQRFLLEAPAASSWALLTAWISFLTAAMLMGSARLGQTNSSTLIHMDRLRGIVQGCAILVVLNYAYIAAGNGALFFLADRDDFNSDGVTLIGKWFVALGMVASILTSNRRYTIFFVIMLGITFLAGDRTMVAIVTASSLVALAHTSGGVGKLLKGRVIVGLIVASAIVVFGKPIYISVKSFFGGTGLESGTSLEATLMTFEPLVIYSHLSYVMDTNVKIGIGEFLASVFGNLLLVPSFFGLSTNLYNEIVQSSFSFGITYGVAGSYLAHGWAVGGVLGVILFYGLYVLALAWCDMQFARQGGLRKTMIGCVGGVLAFYAHRNGMDNLGSFVRQIVLAGVAVAIVTAGLKALVPRPCAKVEAT